MNQSTVLGFALGVAALAFAIPAQEPAATAPTTTKHTLRYAFVKGSVSYSKMTQTADSKMNMGGQSMDTTMNQVVFVESKVIDVSDAGIATVEKKIFRMVVKLDSPVMQLDYDSDEAEADPGPMASMVEAIGKTFTLKVDDRGRIKEFALPEDVDLGEVADQFEGQFKQSITEFPEEPVAIDGTWELDAAQPLGQMGDVDAKTINTLKAVGDGVWTIHQRIEMDLEKAELPMPMALKLEEAGGTIEIDRGSPLPKALDMVMKMSGSLGEEASMTMAMTVHMKVEGAEAPAKKTDAAGKSGGN